MTHIALWEAAGPEPVAQPWSCFQAALPVLLWCRPTNRAGNHHFTARPIAVRRHQQSGSQPQLRLRGLCRRCRTLLVTHAA